MGRQHSLDVQQVKLAILHFAKQHDLDSAVLVEAIADITGMTAAVLDRQVGLQSFDERMAEFSERARAAYLRAPIAKASDGHAVLLSR